MPHFVDYFAVCGLHGDAFQADSSPAHLPPLARPYSCQLLAHYPDKRPGNPLDESAVKTLSMPEGLLIKKNLKDDQKSFHSFVITRENGTQGYGASLTFYEHITDHKVLNTVEAFQSQFELKRQQLSLSSVHEEHLRRSEGDQLFALKALCLLTSRPMVHPLHCYLEQLYAVGVAGKPCKLPIESYIYNLLFEVPPLGMGKTVQFAGPLGSVTWRLPSFKELPLCDYSFIEFFELLGIRNIMRLLASILLEHQILLKSSDYERLMLCAYCSTCLLFPFSWSHVFVPVLPASQRSFLDAPVPYLMGLRVQHSSADNKYLSLPNVSSLCSVDIDGGLVECPDELPGLPDEERLLLRLSEQVQLHGGVSCSDVLPRSPDLSPHKPNIIEAIKFVKEISGSVQSHELKKLLSDTAMINPHIPNLLNIAARAGMKTPLSPTVSLDEGAYDLEDIDDGSEAKNEWDFTPDPSEARFARMIRDVFLDYFVERFANYENFIIMPRQTYDQWVRNREQFQNFDKTAFLSDQPRNHWPFYSAFLESTMFTNFIDEKITTLWEPERTGQNLRLFDSRVEQFRDKSGLPKLPTTPGSRTESVSSECADGGGGVIDEISPLPHRVGKEGAAVLENKPHSQTFPILDAALLQPSDTDEVAGSSLLLGHLQLPRQPSGTTLIGERTSRPSVLYSRLRPSSGSSSSSSSGVGSGFSSQSHAKFVSQLMRESRLRVKHMLGSSREAESTIEENTHIAYLCDLLERIWGHGLKKRESKSPLWTHLMAYAASVGPEQFASSPDSMQAVVSSARRSTLASSSMSSLAHLTTTAPVSPEDSPRSQNLKAHFRRRKFQSPQLRARLEAILQPAPSSLSADLYIVHSMRELKTDVGRARAWVRLALEKKTLSKHLSELLSHEELCSRRYREYAFLRTDEEREQFLYHLLTLTARDFSCFTTGFLTTMVTYRVLVVGEGKHFGLSTACLYVLLAGEVGEAGVAEMPRGEYQTDISCCNLGPLTCLRIGHDNTGLTPSLYVEMVLIHNLTTAQTYRFNCGRWFARSDEDGSVERFLVAEKVPQTIVKSCSMSALNVDSVLPSSPSRRRSSKRDTEEKPVISDIKNCLRTVMDRLKTLALSKHQGSTQEMMQLIHGRKGFIFCCEQVFQFGFRNSRKFLKKLFVWDVLERVHEQVALEHPSDLSSSGATSPDDETRTRQMFLNVITRINSNNAYIGKDEKAQRFFCLGLRDHYLTGWIELLSQSPLVEVLYDPTALLRDSESLQFLSESLVLTHSLPIKLEPIFVQGL